MEHWKTTATIADAESTKKVRTLAEGQFPDGTPIIDIEDELMDHIATEADETFDDYDIVNIQTTKIE